MTTPILPVPVYVLAGGRSSRFGSDKTRAPIGDTALIARLVQSLLPIAAGVTVAAAEAGAYGDLGLDAIGDRHVGKGPLGGLQAALADLRGPGWLALVAGDWVGVRPEWIAALARAAEPSAQYVLYRHARREPLFALYHSSIGGTVDRHLASGRLAMHDLIDAVAGIELPAPPDWHTAANINRPSDLVQYMEKKEQRTCAISAGRS